MRPRKPVLTEQELEIMKIVWQREKATVRDVYEALLEHRKIAYTSVMTMMGVLENKGHLVRSAEEKAHVYRPTQPQKQVLGNMVSEFVDRVFNGSVRPLLLHLAEREHLTAEELDDISNELRKSRAKTRAARS
jgi:predicted transcriptional regulator